MLSLIKAIQRRDLQQSRSHVYVPTCLGLIKVTIKDQYNRIIFVQTECEQNRDEKEEPDWKSLHSPPPIPHYYVLSSAISRCGTTLREESSQTNVILECKLLALILSAVCSVIQQSQYVFHIYYTVYDVKYNCKIPMHQTIFQLQCFALLNNHQYNFNITKSFLSVVQTESGKYE